MKMQNEIRSIQFNQLQVPEGALLDIGMEPEYIVTSAFLSRHGELIIDSGLQVPNNIGACIWHKTS